MPNSKTSHRDLSSNGGAGTPFYPSYSRSDDQEGLRLSFRGPSCHNGGWSVEQNRYATTSTSCTLDDIYRALQGLSQEVHNVKQISSDARNESQNLRLRLEAVESAVTLARNFMIRQESLQKERDDRANSFPSQACINQAIADIEIYFSKSQPSFPKLHKLRFNLLIVEVDILLIQMLE
jgi:hypothetical protein